MKPEILVVSVNYKCKGGIATVVNTFIDNEALKEKFNIKHFASVNTEAGAFKALNMILSMLFFPFFLFLNKFQAAHIHGGSVFRKSYYILWLRIFKIPIAYQNHAANLDIYYQKLPPFKKRYVNFVFGMCDLRLCLGCFWKKTLSTLTTLEWNILHNPVPEIEVTKKQHNGCSFIFLGELSNRKGVRDLIHAFAKSGQLQSRLFIAGNGDSKELSELCIELGINDRVEFLGWINSEQKLNLLSYADVLVLPSYAEGLPMSILEAMSAGLPIIATNVGSIEDAVANDENGVLIQPGDVDALAAAIIELGNDAQKRSQLGRISRVKFLKFFKEEVIVYELIKYYEYLLKRAK